MIAAGRGETPGMPFVLAASGGALIFAVTSGEGRDAGNQATGREEFNQTFGERASRRHRLAGRRRGKMWPR